MKITPETASIIPLIPKLMSRERTQHVAIMLSMQGWAQNGGWMLCSADTSYKAHPLVEISFGPDFITTLISSRSIADRTVCCVTPRRLLASFTLMNPLGREVTAFPPLSASA